MKNRRTSNDIILEILNMAKEPIGKTRVMYQANLSYFQTKEYIGQLQNSRAIETKDGKYVVTEKGREMINIATRRERLDQEINTLLQTTWDLRHIRTLVEYQ